MPIIVFALVVILARLDIPDPPLQRHSSLRKRDRGDSSATKLVSFAPIAPEQFYHSSGDADNRKRERQLDDVRKVLASHPEQSATVLPLVTRMDASVMIEEVHCFESLGTSS